MPTVRYISTLACRSGKQLSWMQSGGALSAAPQFTLHAPNLCYHSQCQCLRQIHIYCVNTSTLTQGIGLYWRPGLCNRYILSVHTQILALLGQAGTGKSIFLRVLKCLLDPSGADLPGRIREAVIFIYGQVTAGYCA